MDVTGNPDPGSAAEAARWAGHQPVLIEETMTALAIEPTGIYIDATFGRGGHARALLERLGPHGRLLAFDRDPDAVQAGEHLARLDRRLQISHARMSDIQTTVQAQALNGHIQGVLLDLGVSSPQLDTPERGFSFTHDGPLDMRMDPTQGEPVSAWLARVSVSDLAELLRQEGEERFAMRIARAVVRERDQRPLLTTQALARLIERVVPTREPGKHPATRSFQALRMRINQELDELQAGLAGIVDVLAANGRLVVISFHSLEDRIVKRFMRAQASGPRVPKSVPLQGMATLGRLRVLGSPVRPTAAEVRRNPRARSAILRVAERRP